MATWTEISTLANTQAFQDRVRAAISKAAIDIVGEAQPVANSDKRQALGLKILHGRNSNSIKYEKREQRDDV